MGGSSNNGSRRSRSERLEGNDRRSKEVKREKRKGGAS